MNSSYQPRRFQKTVIGLIVLIVTIGIFVAVTPTAQSWLLRWGQILSGVGSLLLSGLLVVLYRQQMNLLAAEHRPFVEVENHEPSDDNLYVYLSNVGKGIATDLELVTVTVFPPTERHEPGIARTRLTRKPKENEEYRRGQSLRPSEDWIPFETLPALGMDKSTHGFGSGLGTLCRENVSVIRIHFYIRYTDALGQHHLQYFDGLEVDGDIGHVTLEEAYNQGGRMIGGQPEVSPSDLELDLSTAERREERTAV